MVTISFHFSLITLFSLLPHEDRSLFSLFNHQGDKKKKKSTARWESLTAVHEFTVYNLMHH